MPKGSPSNIAFGRSVLILTPQRALKFTATTRERHHIWLTALSFLSHSSFAASDLTTLPPVPAQEYHPPSHQKPTSSLRRNPIRDSIRVAKGKPRPMFNRDSQSYTATTGVTSPQATRFPSFPTTTAFNKKDEDEDAAQPPNIPRSSARTRKRSNTGPLPISPQLSTFRSFSATVKSSRDSFKAAKSGSTDALSSSGQNTSIYEGDYGGSIGGAYTASRSHIFDTVGAITRMEAFVDRTSRQPLPRSQTHAYTGVEPLPSPMMEVRGRCDVDGAKEPYTRYSYRNLQGRMKDFNCNNTDGDDDDEGSAEEGG